MRAGRSGALAVAVALALSACSVSLVSSARPTPAADAPVGGTLYMLRLGPVDSWDPQRLYVAADMAFAGRVFERTLTSWAPATEQDTLPDLVPDLATDTGTATSGGRVWRFTLRDGVTWQDGKPVTCDDVKYGVSRTFATAQITGGMANALALLDVPSNADGSSTYAGPYVRTGQGGFDKAVTCSGQAITFKLRKPVPDFNQLVALPAFGPVRADKDQGATSTTEIFSNGPYMLQGVWAPGNGATFVRNPHWDRTSDPVRQAHPSRIDFEEGIPVESAVSRIMTTAGLDSFAVTADSAPPALQNDIMFTPSIKASRPIPARRSWTISCRTSAGRRWPTSKSARRSPSPPTGRHTSRPLAETSPPRRPTP